MKRSHPTIALLQWLTAAYAAGFVGSQAVLRDAGALYASLRRPVWAPPAWVFAPVWTVLYALIGLAAWRVWRTEGKGRKGLGLWWLGLALNALWPWLFFGFGKFGAAFGEIVVLWLVIVATTVAFSKSDRKAAWMLIPYLVWVGLASILNLAIWRMN